MRYASRAILAGALGFAAAFVVACGGSSGLLSGDQASTLTDQLNSVSSALANKNCGEVSNATIKLGNDVINLPSSVNSTLRNNLTQGVSTIGQLARRQCQNVPATPTTQPNTTTTTTTTTTAETHTTTTPSTPSNTTTTPSTPTNTTTAPATTSTPSGTNSTGTGGAGFGQGNGNSSGGSGTGGTGNAQ